MRVRKLIKCFTWTNPERDDVVLGANTRLNADTHRAQLLADADGLFPTAADLFVKSRLTTPKAARKLIGFEAIVIHKGDPDDPTALVTSTQYRIDDGTTEFYWDGASWTAAGASDWNTEQEVADNIANFDLQAASKTFRIVVNLATTDERFTPELVEVRVLYEALIDSFQEDMIYRSLLPLLRANVRPISRVVVAMPATGTTLNVSDFQVETGYNITGVDSVFDFDADADAAREGTAPDLLDSFDSGTGVITLNTSVTQGTNLWIRFEYEPEVAWNQSQDFVEAERVPAIVLDDVELIDAVESPTGQLSVANKAALTATVCPAPVQGDLSLTLVVMTDKGVDQQRLAEELNAFFQRTPFIISTAMDERYRLHLIDEYEAVGTPDQNEIHTGQLTARVRNFRQWLKDSFTENIVGSQGPTFSMSFGG